MKPCKVCGMKIANQYTYCGNCKPKRKRKSKHCQCCGKLIEVPKANGQKFCDDCAKTEADNRSREWRKELYRLSSDAQYWIDWNGSGTSTEWMNGISDQMRKNGGTYYPTHYKPDPEFKPVSVKI